MSNWLRKIISQFRLFEETLFTIIISLFIIITSSCSKERTEERTERFGVTLEDRNYKITSFISPNLIDLNNDGTTNTNVLLELTNYYPISYDFQIKIKRELVLYSFSFPFQNIDEVGFVQFSAYGYLLSTRFEHNIYDYDLDSETKILILEKTSKSSYKLKLKRKYFDFSTNQYTNYEYEITYELK